MRIENAGVVEEDVETSEVGYGLIDCAAAFSCLANIGAQEDGLTAAFQNPGSDRVPPLFVAARDRDLGALFGKEDGSGFADARRASGDESDFVFERHMKSFRLA